MSNLPIDLPRAPRRQSRGPRGNTKGWAYFNEDTGFEWTVQHPVESGETPDATEIEAMTLSEFYRQHPRED